MFAHVRSESKLTTPRRRRTMTIAAQFDFNQQSAYDSKGNLFIADFSNSRVRRIAADGIITTVAGDGVKATTGDGGPAVDAEVWEPEGLVIDGSDNIYISEFRGNRIRKFTDGGTISTIAGTGVYGDSGDGGLATAAEIGNPAGLGLDPAGNVYFAQTGDNVIRKIDQTSGLITRVAGDGTTGFSGDGGPATAAQLDNPRAVSVIGSDLIISDSGNNRIRSVSAGGTITTIAGTGTAGFSGDGGPATAAEFYDPIGVVASGSTLYVADEVNSRIRKIEAGVITTVAGTGVLGYSGDGGPALLADLDNPIYPTLDPLGNIVFSDTDNNVVRRIQLTAAPVPPTTSTTAPAGPAPATAATPAFTG